MTPTESAAPFILFPRPYTVTTCVGLRRDSGPGVGNALHLCLSRLAGTLPIPLLLARVGLLDALITIALVEDLLLFCGVVEQALWTGSAFRSPFVLLLLKWEHVVRRTLSRSSCALYLRHCVWVIVLCLLCVWT